MTEQNSKPTLRGAKDLFNQAWVIFTKRFWTLIGIVIIPYLLRHFTELASIGFISFLPVFIINFWGIGALIYAITREEEIDIKEAYLKTWPMALSVIWIFFLQSLVISGGVNAFGYTGNN